MGVAVPIKFYGCWNLNFTVVMCHKTWHFVIWFFFRLLKLYESIQPSVLPSQKIGNGVNSPKPMILSWSFWWQFLSRNHPVATHSSTQKILWKVLWDVTMNQGQRTNTYFLLYHNIIPPWYLVGLGLLAYIACNLMSELVILPWFIFCLQIF